MSSQITKRQTLVRAAHPTAMPRMRPTICRVRRAHHNGQEHRA